MKGTKVTLGGKERELRYDLNAVAEIGDKLGIKIRLGHFQEDLLGVPLPLSALRTILWAGLITQDPSLDEKSVGAWVDQDNLMDVLNSFFSLFGGTSPATRLAVAEKLGVEIEAGEESQMQ